MAADKPIKYNSQIEKDQSDDSANIVGKRSILYGWNPSTLQYERVQVVDGILQSSIVVDSVTATVTNDNTFAKETGGNLDTIKTDLDTIVTNTNKIISAPATSANQATELTNLALIDTDIKANQPRNIYDGAGNSLPSSTSDPTGSERGLIVRTISDPINRRLDEINYIQNFITNINTLITSESENSQRAGFEMR